MSVVLDRPGAEPTSGHEPAPERVGLAGGKHGVLQDREGAAELVGRLMLEPPRETPPEVKEAMAEDDVRDAKAVARAGLWAVGSALFFIPLLWWIAPAGSPYVPALLTFLLLDGVVALAAVKVKNPKPGLVIIANTIIVIALARMFSPILIAPGIAGFDGELNQRVPYDPARAQELLAEAGYGDGFPLTIDCPNDRYVNDEEICTAVAGMLQKIGVAAEVNAQTKSKHFAKAGSAEGYNTSMYMLGWIPGTYDAHHVLHNLMTLHAAPEDSGIWNAGKWTDPRVEELTKAIAAEMDPDKRTPMIHEALRIHKEDFGHLPLHQEALAWGVADSVVDIKQSPNDFLILEEIRMQ